MRNIWAGYHRPWGKGDIENIKFRVLESPMPGRLQSCSSTHPCKMCNGWGTRSEVRCEACGGTGVGAIRPGRDYCPVCCKCSPNIESDPRLIIIRDKLPSPEPRPKPESRPKPIDDTPRRKPGRPKGSKDTKPRRKRRTTPASV